MCDALSAAAVPGICVKTRLSASNPAHCIGISADSCICVDAKFFTCNEVKLAKHEPVNSASKNLLTREWISISLPASPACDWPDQCHWSNWKSTYMPSAFWALPDHSPIQGGGAFNMRLYLFCMLDQFVLSCSYHATTQSSRRSAFKQQQQQQQTLVYMLRSIASDDVLLRKACKVAEEMKSGWLDGMRSILETPLEHLQEENSILTGAHEDLARWLC